MIQTSDIGEDIDCELNASSDSNSQDHISNHSIEGLPDEIDKKTDFRLKKKKPLTSNNSKIMKYFQFSRSRHY